MKIAFASQDKTWVNAHFGWAQYILIYEIDTEHAKLDAIHDFGDKLNADGNDNKLAPKLAAIQDCAIVYLSAIGGAAAAKIVARKIHPVKLRDPEPIDHLIERLQTVLKGTPPPWLRKALRKDQQPSLSFEE